MTAIVTEDTKLIDTAWNDPEYSLEGRDYNRGTISFIDRDQAVDDDGKAMYDSYVFSKDGDGENPEVKTVEFDAETMERYAEEW